MNSVDAKVTTRSQKVGLSPKENHHMRAKYMESMLRASYSRQSGMYLTRQYIHRPHILARPGRCVECSVKHWVIVLAK